MSAAVADYKAKHYSDKKIKKGNEDLVIEFERDSDILKLLGKVKKDNILVGFAAESNDLLENARGKYIYFLDSDDWLEKDGLSKLANTLKTFGDVDVVAFLHCSVNATTHFKQDFPPTPEYLTNQVVNIYDTPECIQHLGYGMTKIIRRNLLQEFNIKFNNDKCFEDVGHFLDLIPKIKSIVFINEKIFNYRILRRGSVISKKDDYIKYLLKYSRKAEEISKNFPAKVRLQLLKKIYKTLAYTTLLVYANFKISHSELKNIFGEYIDYEILREADMSYYRSMYNKIMNDNELIFCIENFLRMKFKELFPTFFDFYKHLKLAILKK